MIRLQSIALKASAALAMSALAGNSTADIVSATLPSSRSVQINQTTTVFATVINAGTEAATQCSPSLPGTFSGQFSFQTTDSITNLPTGVPNQPIDLAAGGTQSFVLALTPTVELIQRDTEILLSCTSGESAPSITGLNTLLLSASDAPTPDIIALAAANSGVVDLDSDTDAGAFAVATTNIGSNGAITVAVSGANLSSGVALSICQTDARGQCITPAEGPTTSPFVTNMTNLETSTFSVFASSADPIVFDPAHRRVFVTFASEDGIVRGSTSVAIQKPTSRAVQHSIRAATASDYQPPYLPLNVIDGDTSRSSRWSAEGRSDVWLQLDLGEHRTVNTLEMRFLDNDLRDTCFNIATSDDAIQWTRQRSNISSDGDAFFSFPDTFARYVRYEGMGNTTNDWNSVIEAGLWQLTLEDTVDTGDGVPDFCNDNRDDDHSAESDVLIGDQTRSSGVSFDPGSVLASLTPEENFDLTQWKITYPDASEEDPPLVVSGEFYTDSNTGAMVFQCPNRASTTSSATKYSRTELREMLRKTSGAKSLGNNWVISSASNAAQNAAGGVDGTMKATLSVDHVSETTDPGDEFMLGRVIVGQIHAANDEPLKIYYRKQPGHTHGSVYMAYEDSNVELYIDLFGSKDTSSNPTDGIRLGEKWAYDVTVTGRDMRVTVIKQDGSAVTQDITWASEYNSDWFYFKAGNYNQNNGGEDGEYARVSFYALDVTHN